MNCHRGGLNGQTYILSGKITMSNLHPVVHTHTRSPSCLSGEKEAKCTLPTQQQTFKRDKNKIHLRSTMNFFFPMVKIKQTQ